MVGGVANPDLFVDPETRFPIAFYVHPTIKGSKINNLGNDIKNYGGTVVSDVVGADVVLISEKQSKDWRRTLQLAYHGSKDKRKRNAHVEIATFVRHCIKQGRFAYTYTNDKSRGMGGSLHRPRMVFTHKDDIRLARWIAMIIPSKSAGGRRGNDLYKELVEMSKVDEEYKWVNRHTWQAWRNRYNKDVERLDELIKEIVTTENPEKQHRWYTDRRLNKVRLRVGRQLSDGGSEDEEGESDEVESGDDMSEDQNHAEEFHISPRGNKRRQSRRDSSLADQPAGKRQRTNETSNDRFSTNPPRYAARRPANFGAPTSQKGKEKELPMPEEEEEEESDLTSYSDEPVADPDPTAVQHSSYNPESPTPGPSNPHSHRLSGSELYISQQTLVGSAPLPTTSPIKSAMASTKRPGDRRRSARFNEESVVTPVESTSPHRPMREDRVLPDADGEFQPQSSPAFQPTPSYSRKVPQTSTPLPAKITTSEVPYRMTRSRSRSVEPTAFLSLPTGTKSRKKGTGKAKASNEEDTKPLRPVDEVNAEEENAGEHALIENPETLADEQDVAELLIANANDSSGASNLEEGIANLVQDNLAARSPSIETDDQQIKQELALHRLGSPVVSPRPLVQASDILKAFEASGASKPHHSLPSEAHTDIFKRGFTRGSSTASARPRLSEPLADHQFNSTPDSRLPTTPVRKSGLSRLREQSVSSSDNFPLDGTRASAYKKTRSQRERSAPYEPLAGTRAAQLASRRLPPL